MGKRKQKLSPIAHDCFEELRCAAANASPIGHSHQEDEHHYGSGCERRLTILVDAHERSNRKMGGIGSIMQTPNYPENVAEKNSPESLVVRFAEPVGTEADALRLSEALGQ